MSEKDAPGKKDQAKVPDHGGSTQSSIRRVGRHPEQGVSPTSAAKKDVVPLTLRVRKLQSGFVSEGILAGALWMTISLGLDHDPLHDPLQANRLIVLAFG